MTSVTLSLSRNGCRRIGGPRESLRPLRQHSLGQRCRGACGALYPMNKPPGPSSPGVVASHEGGYVRHPSCILETVSQRYGHFLLFFFRKNPKHLHAHVTLLR
jgi:hypothetical protein